MKSEFNSRPTLGDIPLSRLQFKNSGTVTRGMRLEYRSRPCYYVEGLEAWRTPWNDAYYSYLYEIRDGRSEDPAGGLRSAIPLGGLGAGTVELRADGSLRDWCIFNNSPAGGGPKVQLDEALFGIRTKMAGVEARAYVLQTHTPRYLPAVAEIEYAGAFPVSRLRISDPDLPISVTLFAYNEFRIRDVERSATPAAIFTFLLGNLTEQAIEASLMFNLPNHIGGHYFFENGLVLSKPGEEPTSGTMAVNATGEGCNLTCISAKTLSAIWRHFTITGEFPSAQAETERLNPIDEVGGRAFSQETRARHGALAVKSMLEPGETKTITFVLAWHFPNRPHAHEVHTNCYARLYASASKVAEKVLARLPATWQAIEEWNRLCFDNSLPEWLQDTMVNSVATMAKTGMWFADGRWRQWESFSCPAIDPIHIHFYRSLPYALFFPHLRRSLLRGYAAVQRDDGYIQENLGDAHSRLDEPCGRMMGDSATTFVLAVYQDYLWTGDRVFLNEIWPHAKKAALWQIHRCEAFGLPNNLSNTYDWWDFEHKELCSYNGFLHLAAILAAERLATIQGDTALAEVCGRNLESSRQALNKHFWTDKYFRSWWMKDESFPDALHADTLYGELWARILGLGCTGDEDKIRSHLAAELDRNGSCFGLKVMRDAGSNNDGLAGMTHGDECPRDDLIWEAGSIDWCALNIYLGGDVNEGLAEAKRVINKWRMKLRDQWDIRDLSTGWDGYPWCNSHYARQLILWAIPLALSGQQYSAVDKTLTFAPVVPAPAKLPFFTPSASGTLELIEDNQIKLIVLSGRLEVECLRIGSISVNRRIVLDRNDILEVP